MTAAAPASEQTLDQVAINSIRFLAVDAVQKANSGHPGLPLDAAPMAYTLWTRFMRYNPHNPNWANRDRFVLSAGHGSMLLYALLYLTGFEAMTMEQIQNFRQWGSHTPGHPERGEIPGVEVTTGPLGAGFSNAVGFAMAEAYLGAHFNQPDHTIVDHYTYVIASDGDLMEGVASEAASLAGHLKLHKLVVLYDDNQVSLSTKTDVTFTEDVAERFRAYGWNTLKVADGNDVAAIGGALAEAKTQTSAPTLISVRTILGYGSKYAGTPRAHGEPLGKDEVAATKAKLGWPSDENFYVPGQALEHFREAITRGEQWEAEWNKAFQSYQSAFPELAAQWTAAQNTDLPAGWDADLPSFPAGSPAMATRDANGQALNALAKHFPTMIGGDADLFTSTKTTIKDGGDFDQGNYSGRNLHFGVREHAMGGIANGLAAHGGIIKPYTATFLTFSDYMRPPIRLAALMTIPTVFVFTHDSIGVGEDGPTHQPIEQVPSLRAIPQLVTFRPADANESVAAWRTAMTLRGPSVLIFSRQKLPIYAPEGVMEGTAKGAYIRAEADGGTPDVLLLSAGSEVSIAMDARDLLAKDGIKARVVSMPSWELFRHQDQAYRDHVLPPTITARVSIEATAPQGWYEWVGLQGKVIGLDHFGASAPYEQIYQHFGLTPDAMAQAAKAVLGR